MCEKRFDNGQIFILCCFDNHVLYFSYHLIYYVEYLHELTVTQNLCLFLPSIYVTCLLPHAFYTPQRLRLNQFKLIKEVSMCSVIKEKWCSLTIYGLEDAA